MENVKSASDNTPEQGVGGKTDPASVLAVVQKEYEKRCEELGKDHPDTLKTLHELALVHYYLKDHEKAHELLKRTYLLQCTVLGNQHQETLRTLSYLALTYHALGYYQKSLRLFENAYEFHGRTLKDDHPMMVRLRQYILEAKEKLAEQ